MTDLNPKVLEEKGAELQAQMAKDIEGLDIRDCDLIGAISSIAHESNQLEGTLACVVLFHGTEEEWLEEREALLRNFEQNSIEALKEHLRVPGLSLSIIRADMAVRLHDNLLGVKEIVDKHKLDRAIVYVAQQTQPELDAVGMSNMFHGQKFDWTFRPTKGSKEVEFTLALNAVAQGGAKPIAYTYRVGELVPDPVSHLDNWPTSVFVDIPGHQKIFEIMETGPADYLTAYDLLQMFLTETGQLEANNDTKVVFYLPSMTDTRSVGYSGFGERLFVSERFQGLLPRLPQAELYSSEVDTAMANYSDLLQSSQDPMIDIVFLSTSMQGEEFVNVREELDQLLATETEHNTSMMFHSFVPGSIDLPGLLGYIRETISAERRTVVYISPHFKYKESEVE